ncbi:MAG: SAM-dependent methyltransferase [Desulfovibrionaceae bacterium CG1_02_65_16]|nr:MAG: SAM-dependent methyltransferase [Desulfovibrionaceae bacterium CG1_02_65_16]
MKQQALAAKRFGAVAQEYLTSSCHARGVDLARLADLARELGRPMALDLGCGAGHAAYALAEGGAEVMAYDLSAEMLTVVEEEAARRGLTSLHVRQGAAERLPFDDGSFDLVVTRYSAHHWAYVPAALREARRVLKPGGSLVVIDVIAPEAPVADTLLQTVELLRDPSHVRDYRVSEWAVMLQAAGFSAPETDMWPLPMDFAAWLARMETSELRAKAVRDVLAKAAEEARRHFHVEADGSFSLDAAWLRTTRTA